MRVNICEPRLRYTGGHFLEYCRNLSGALKQAGADVHVYAAQAVDPAVIASLAQMGVPCHGIFRSCIDDMQEDQKSSRQYILDLSMSQAMDMHKARRPDLWFIPTLMPEMLHAYARLENAAPMTGIVMVHPSRRHAYGARLWFDACQKIATHNLPVKLLSIDDHIGAVVATMSCGLPIKTAPMPQDGVAFTSPRHELRRIGFFGYQRNERGAGLIPAIVSHLLSQDFEVVMQDSNQHGPFSLQPHPRLHRLGYVENFAEAISQCDAVLNPITAISYATMASAVVFDCLASGIPVVLPAGCLPAIHVMQYTGLTSTLYPMSTLPAIATTIAMLQNNMHAVSIGFQAGAKMWAARNGSARLASMVLTSDQNYMQKRA